MANGQGLKKAVRLRTKPVMLRSHRTERGVGSRSGKWAIVREESTVKRDGAVETVSRRVVHWVTDLSRALLTCSELDGLTG